MANFQRGELAEILAIARSVGWGAADILLKAQHSTFGIEESGESPVTTADLAANQYILDSLQASLGTQDFAYLSEETFKNQPISARRGKPWVWIIDPLDGTKDFINKTGEYAVHIALTHEGRPLLAVVACPEFGKLYYATLGNGTFVETREDVHPKKLQVSDKTRPKDLTIVTSRSHRDDRLNQLVDQFPHKSQRQVGSIGCKIAAIVEHQADLYLSLSSKSAPKDWDFAAPDLILTEAGGSLTHFDNTPLLYNQDDVNQWGGLLASNGHCHAELCDRATQLLSEIDQ
ncbi:3'(2'),5'-bisphosphate nucleotidase CysQ family protein [Phormidesmis sp. 146-33]